MKIHQFAPAIRAADATSAHALRVRELLRSRGFESEIFVEEDAPLVEGVLPVGRFRSDGDTVALYQFAIGSVLTETLLASRVPLALNFHNLTPAEHYDAWAPGIATSLRWSMGQLRLLAPKVALGVAVSRFNAVELERVGVADTVVAPILLAPSVVEAPSSSSERAPSIPGARWLFVGRLAPNKAQHDLLVAFALHRRVFDPEATLCLVGAPATARYEQALHALARSLGVAQAVDFAGSVSEADLGARYDDADVFVCLSDHEGFCVPLLEAMARRLPIVAFASSAVPETLGAAGVCLPEKSPALVATAVHRVLTDGALRDELVAAGVARLDVLGPEAAVRSWDVAIDRLAALI